MNYDYIASSIREGIEELSTIATLAERKELRAEEFKVRLYAALLDVFRAYNLKSASLRDANFDVASLPPKDILELFN